MLELAAKKKVKSYIELLPSASFSFPDVRLTLNIPIIALVKDAGKAVKNVKENNVRYRHVLKYVVLCSRKRHCLMADCYKFQQDGHLVSVYC